MLAAAREGDSLKVQFKFLPPDQGELFKEAADALYMMYRSLVEAGFSEGQAMQITLETLVAQIKGGGGI